MPRQCLLGAVCLSLLSLTLDPADEPKDKAPSLEDDAKALVGKWVAPKGGTGPKELTVEAGKGKLVLAWVPKPGVSVSGIDYTVKQAGKVRVVECLDDTAELANVPARFEYRFDKGELIMTVEKGPLKGEHRLQPAKSK